MTVLDEGELRFTFGPDWQAEMFDAERRRLKESIGDARRLLADTPTEARPGKNCGYCPARVRYGIGWRAYQASLDRPRASTTDIEVAFAAEPPANGFLAEAGGREMDVVYDDVVGQHFSQVGVGVRIRLLHVVVRDEGKTFDVHPWTKVYGVDEEG